MGDDVFVSYASEDRTVAQRVVSGLRDGGLTVRWDDDLGPGDGWEASLGEWADTAAAVVVLWSAASEASSHVVREASRAEERKALVPVSIDGTIPQAFRSLQALDLRGWDGDPSDPRFERLVRALETRTSSGRPAPPETAATPRMPWRPAALEVLGLALASAESRGADEVSETDVLLATLLLPEHTSLDRAQLSRGATAAVVRSTPEPRSGRVRSALRAVGASERLETRTSADPADPRLTAVLATATALAGRAGAKQLYAHHVLAAALAGRPSGRALEALGVDLDSLRAALRDSVADRWPEESATAWDAALGAAGRAGPRLEQQVFTVHADARSGPRGVALLVDRRTLVTTPGVVDPEGRCYLERLTTAGTRRRIGAVVSHEHPSLTVLRLTGRNSVPAPPVRLATEVPRAGTEVMILCVRRDGEIVLLAGTAEPTEDGLLVVLPREVAARLDELPGAPVVTTEAVVVGIVSQVLSGAVAAVPARDILRLLDDQPVDPDTAAPPTEASPSEEQPAEEQPAEEPLLGGTLDSDLVVWDDDRPLVDRLAIEDYVNMLSLVVAAADTPLPLSIGLFGRWGSGKTYFMGLMRQAIARLAEAAGQDRAAGRTPVSCETIIPITFNAWHYADANLWASLAVRIFDELAGRDEAERAQLDEQRRRLIESLEVYRQLEHELEVDRKLAEGKARRLQGRLDAARERRTLADTKLKGLRAAHVADAVAADPRLQELWGRTSTELREAGLAGDRAALGETAVELDLQLRRAFSLRTVLADRGRLRALALVVPVLLLAGVVLLVAPGVLRAVGGASLVAGVLAALRVVVWLQDRAAGLRRVLDHVERTISVADDVRSRVVARNDVEIAEAEAAVAAADAEILDLEDRRADVARSAEDASRQLDELHAGARLRRLIAERSASSDYRRQLGVVSMARRDFEDLTRALHAAMEQAAADGSTPAVERIVLFVDDLDRCSAERVVEVLEAVHLLLAMDLFVVVVGVDPRWLLRSLRQRFQGPEVVTADGQEWQWTPQPYLEKIFQIPFALPPMAPHAYLQLLTSLAAPRVSRSESDAGDATAEGIAAEGTIPESVAEPVELEAEEGSPVAAMASEAPLAQHDVAEGVSGPAEARTFLDLTEPEVELLGALAPLVGTPRAAKRMLNIYRMLRVTRDLGPASRFLAEDHQAVCQLVSLLTGAPAVFSRVVSGDPAAPRPGLLDRSDDDSWSDFVDDLVPRLDDGRWTNGVCREIEPPSLEEWTAATTALTSIRPALRLPDRLAPYKLWAPRISRFSFDLSVVAGAIHLGPTEATGVAGS
jgi:hypothetical protein